MSVLLLSHNTPPKIIESAESLGFHTMRMPSMPDMPPPVSSHPDMLLFAGFGRIFVRSAHMKNDDFSSAVSNLLGYTSDLTLTVTSDTPSNSYPFDIAFNCAVFGDSLVGLADYISPSVKRAASDAMTPTLNVAQGYAKCSTLITDESDVITADKSINHIASELGINSLLISPGTITLPGYDSGFIGGASFFADNTAYFLGSLESHPSYTAIKQFASEHNFRTVSLSDEPLFDAGCLYIR